jgi:hypothetical protein
MVTPDGTGGGELAKNDPAGGLWRAARRAFSL